MKKIDALWYVGVGIPLYVMIYLGAASLDPGLNFYGYLTGGSQYYQGYYNTSFFQFLSWTPSQFFAPIFIVAGLLGFLGIGIHFKLSGSYKR